MNDPMSATWDWKSLLVECPACGAAMSPTRASSHADWHWLTNTTPQRLRVGTDD